MKSLVYIAQRLLWSLLVLWIVITAVFFLVRGIGDPAKARFGPKAPASVLQQYRHQHGLDRPLHHQYGAYLEGILHGDLGRSRADDRPIAEVIGVRLPRTVLLGLLAMLFELGIGLTIGIVAATKRNTWVDTSLMSLTFLGISAPTFITGILFLNWLAFRLGWFPVGGYGFGFWENLWHTILPAFTLAIFGSATYARLLRSDLIEQLQSDHVRTANAKGLRPWVVLTRHAVRNALLPVITLMGLSLQTLVSGAVITETIFAYPGIGRLAWESISSWDDMVILSVTSLSAAAVLVGNILADIGVSIADPRIRL